MASLIRILIADDHAVVREGLKALINGKPDLTVIGEAADGLEAVDRAGALQPDVILMDLVMPHHNGLEAIRAIKWTNPAARILVLTSFAEDDQVFTAIKAGALGYLLKDSSPQELIEAIRCVYRGEPSLHPVVAKKLVLGLGQEPKEETDPGPLTERELEVLKLLARGLSNQDIAQALVVGEGTIRFHVTNILSKLQLENRTQAVLYALRQGIAGLEG
jgi:two-component system, NarL family, response regulator LiaR